MSIERLLKLRKMSAGELNVRLRGLLRQRRERKLWQRVPARNGSRVPESRCDRGQLFAALQRLVPGVQAAQRERLELSFRGQANSLRTRAIQAAENVLSGRWDCLGFSVDLRASLAWHEDPRSGFRWPKTFYADVPFCELPDGVDVKYVWELGRQQYLADLARGWLLAGEERFARGVRDLLLGWIGENPSCEGIHWSSALEVAMRAVSWMWALAGLTEWHGWSPDDVDRIACSLADHATYLEQHFSLYSSPYNHLVGEAAGLYLIGLALQEHNAAHRWQRCGREVLLEHGPRQFYRDGFCVEQATGYHYYTLGFLSLAIAAARREGDPLTELEPVLHRAYRAGAAFRQPDGCWPAIGDVDSARSIPVHHDVFWDFNSLSSLGAVLFDDPELAFAHEAGPEVYWLLGCKGLEEFERARQRYGPRDATVGEPAETRGRLAVLEDSGYVIASDGRDWLLFDAGPVAAGLYADATPSAAHGHADTLQVLYWLAGQPVLCDSGTPGYAEPRPWLDHFRGPAAHNTIAIEGAPVARSAPGLAWSHVAPRPSLTAQLSPGLWFARGRAEWSANVVVERCLLASPGQGLWIADRIQTDRPRRVDWYWQFPAETLRQIRRSESGTVVVGSGLAVHSWSDSTPIHSVLETAADAQPTAWQSSGYGARHAGQRLWQTLVADGVLLAVHFVGAACITNDVLAGGRDRITDLSQSGLLPPLGLTRGKKELLSPLRGTRHSAPLSDLTDAVQGGAPAPSRSRGRAFVPSIPPQ